MPISYRELLSEASFPIAKLRPFVIAVIAITAFSSCGGNDEIPVKIYLGTRSISKLPFVIAEDQGLFKKHGLDVDLRMPDPNFEGGRTTHDSGLRGQVWRRIWVTLGLRDEWKEDVFVDGLTPNIVKRVDYAGFPHRVAVAATDCVLRAHIVSTSAIETIEELKGRRIGISARRDTTTGFGALVLARRMGWDPIHDVSIKYNGRDVEALEEGQVDAIVASEIRYAVAVKKGLRILADTRDWNVAIAGNSVMVDRSWLANSENHEAIRRLLRATTEAMAIFHNDRELAIQVLQKWHGIDDRDIAEIAYDRGQWMPRKPYPCYEGIKNTFSMYDSSEMRKFAPEDFYDDRYIKELDESGFIDQLY